MVAEMPTSEVFQQFIPYGELDAYVQQQAVAGSSNLPRFSLPVVHTGEGEEDLCAPFAGVVPRET